MTAQTNDNLLSKYNELIEKKAKYEEKREKKTSMCFDLKVSISKIQNSIPDKRIFIIKYILMGLGISAVSVALGGLYSAVLKQPLDMTAIILMITGVVGGASIAITAPIYAELKYKKKYSQELRLLEDKKEEFNKNMEELSQLKSRINQYNEIIKGYSSVLSNYNNNNSNSINITNNYQFNKETGKQKILTKK